LDEEDAKHIFSIAKKICLKMKEKLGAEGVNLVQSSEEVAGQSIPHFHLHVIPRKSNDDLSDLVQWWRSKVKKVDEKQLEEIAKTIKLEEEQKEEKKEERSEEEIYWIRRETELA
jgi:histidine triad (HIT) family protein